ncbi:MAG: hypothetical protein JJ895_03605 [Balneolaceae bacterium]|nr:hypothetical protein [Balneolaceae bacterium]
MTVKKKLIELINDVQDERVLESYYQLLKPLHNQTLRANWSKLNTTELDELLISYDESFNSDNLVPHSSVMEKATKWDDK